MNWKRIPKEHSKQPSSGIYSDWKEIIADEGFHQCVYCAIHDANFGGIRNFHVEHYRPKSNPSFAQLKNNITNLFYACPICNTFKSNDWPCDPVEDFSVYCYPDPSIVDYSDIFEVNQLTGIVTGKFLASKYMVEKVYLNRPQLIMERRVMYLLDQEQRIRHSVKDILHKLDGVANKDTLLYAHRQVTHLLNRLHELKDSLRGISPYHTSDIQR